MTLHLGIFLREPTPGATKTRLARTVGDEGAAALARSFAEDLIARAVEAQPVTLFVAGPLDGAWIRGLRARHGVEAVAQREGGLGTRMAHALRALALRGTGGIALVGSDAPTLPRWMPPELARALEGASVALTPAADGGYVAIATRAEVEPRFLEAPIRYSTRHALADTVAAAEAAGLVTTCVTPWYDIDVEADLHTLWAELALDARRAPRTAEVLRALASGAHSLGGGKALGRNGTGGSKVPQR